MIGIVQLPDFILRGIQMPTSQPFYLIGHRGAAGEHLENSMTGLEHTLSLPLDAFEIDIRENDSKLWVFHDEDLDRLTDRSGSFDDYPDLTSVRLNNGEAIPTLPELLDLCWGKMPLNIEIKSLSNYALLLDLLAEYPPLEPAPGLPWIFLSSFKLDYLLDLQRVGCPWPLAPLNEMPPEECSALIDTLQPRTWHFADDHVDFELVRLLQDAGIMSLVFTVNDAERARYLEARGVAGIFTDYPSEMLQSFGRC